MSESGASHFNFEPLEKLSLGENIAQHLQALLLNGTFRPGDYLPSQRELASRYGTSVAAVREATSILSAAGVLDARPGRGTLVLQPAGGLPSINLWLGTVHDEAEAMAFLDTRQVLEHYTLRRAVRCATPQHLAEMRGLLFEMSQAHHDPERFIQADLSLHFKIAEAASNPVVLRLLRTIHIPLANLHRAISEQLLSEGRFSRLYLIHHDIVAAIEARDPDAAVSAFDQMLGETLANNTLGRALGQPDSADAADLPLGPEFLEDLQWNLLRVIGPMAAVIIAEAASALGVDLSRLTRAHLPGYLGQVAQHLPAGKAEEWNALAGLLLQRYDHPAEGS